MRERGLSVAAFGPGLAVEARRVVGKIAEELEQTSPDHPNVVCFSFFGAAPSPPPIRLAFADLLSEEKKLGEGLDFSKLARVPAILEFSRSKFLKAHINPRIRTKSPF
jgi:hypothetical protein